MDRELATFLKAQFDGVNTRLDSIDSRLDKQDARFDGIDTRLDTHEEQNRHTRVLFEDLASKVDFLAEGYRLLDEKVDRRFEEAEAARKGDRQHLEALIRATYLDLSRRDDEIEEELAIRSSTRRG